MEEYSSSKVTFLIKIIKFLNKKYIIFSIKTVDKFILEIVQIQIIYFKLCLLFNSNVYKMY